MMIMMIKNTYWNTPECQKEQCKVSIRARLEEEIPCRALVLVLYTWFYSILFAAWLSISHCRTHAHCDLYTIFAVIVQLLLSFYLLFGSHAHSRIKGLARQSGKSPRAKTLGCDWNECAKDKGLEPTSLYTTWSSNLITWLDQWNEYAFCFFNPIRNVRPITPHRGEWGTCPLALCCFTFV